ncbi:MAG: hypothetical protein U0573_06820 [Phycisphaerales bacterium]|nr:hypothetical protein [Planctomycetota bacterium]
MAKKPAKSAPKRARSEDSAPAAARRVVAPVDFSKIIGQNRALEILAASIRSAHVHHAWIFYGPAGVGKFTTALSFASLLLDPETTVPAKGWPVAKAGSEVQRLLASGSHPDLGIVTKELARFSDDEQVRDRKLITIPKEVIDEYLVRPSKLAPLMKGGGGGGVGGASKVFIVDEAELMDRSPTNAPTQNSILKTLEEPPPGTVIILVTTNPDRLLPTIRSRSQQVSFAPLSEGDMKRWLQDSKEEIENVTGKPVGPEDSRFLLEFAAGSPGEVVRAHAGNLVEWSRTLEPMLAECDAGKYVVGLGPAMAKLVETWASEEAAKDKQASKDAANRAGAMLLLKLLSQRAQRKLRLGLNKPGLALGAIDAIREAQRQIEANVAMQFVTEWLSTRLSGKEEAVLV